MMPQFDSVESEIQLLNVLDEMRSRKFLTPESNEISAHILSVFKANPQTKDDEAILGYLASVPFFVDAIWQIAVREGEQKQLRPIINHIKNYFLADTDFIPDRKGAIGLLDDAYMVYCYVDRLATKWNDAEGAQFAAPDLSNEMAEMVKLLGEDNARKIEFVADKQLGNASDEHDATEASNFDEKFDVDGATALKYVLGGLAALFAVNQIMKNGQPSESDRWMDVIENQVRHGW